jgi:mannose-6-phosphate isomerase-like protein (cupin superfamily)
LPLAFIDAVPDFTPEGALSRRIVLRMQRKSQYFVLFPAMTRARTEDFLESILHSKYIQRLFHSLPELIKELARMVEAASPPDSRSVDLSSMLVRYTELRPCTTAFIDTRTPGSAEKENFTIIGPGVAESPDQYVHISAPHGFNVGGARQPPDCVNSQHSHETAEVFIVHSGRWAFVLGPNKEDGEVELEPGDVISIPIHVFRGFRNVGEDTGYLYAVLGGDDPGHVTWAPYVFENAKDCGLILLEDGSLIDTTKGEKIPDGKQPMRPTTVEDVARLRRLTADEMKDCVAQHSELVRQYQASGTSANFVETAVIGSASEVDGLAAGKMSWPHGFNVRYIVAEPGATSNKHIRHEVEVVFVHSGKLDIRLPGEEFSMIAGDTLTVPVGMQREFINRSDAPVEAYIVRGGDAPKAAQILSE